MVPIVLSAIVIFHLRAEHSGVGRIATYIGDHMESWLAAGRVAAPKPGAPSGWETHLGPPGGKPRWIWWPLPLWYGMLILTSVVAILAWIWPSLFALLPVAK
jgi:hypothetical protein